MSYYCSPFLFGCFRFEVGARSVDREKRKGKERKGGQWLVVRERERYRYRQAFLRRGGGRGMGGGASLVGKSSRVSVLGAEYRSLYLSSLPRRESGPGGGQRKLWSVGFLLGLLFWESFLVLVHRLRFGFPSFHLATGCLVCFVYSRSQAASMLVRG